MHFRSLHTRSLKRKRRRSHKPQSARLSESRRANSGDLVVHIEVDEDEDDDQDEDEEQVKILRTKARARSLQLEE